MNNNWDLGRLAKIAGVPLMESYDDEGDDGLSASERALASAADKELKKKKVKIGKVDPDKDMARLAKKDAPAEEKKAAPAEKKADVKEEPKKEEPKKADVKEEPKKEEAAAEAKRRGRAPNETSKSGHARAYMTSNPQAKRGEFVKHMTGNHGMSPHHASAKYYEIKKGLKEGYVLRHPYLASFMLAENREMNQMQWVDPYSPLDILFFETKAEADKIAKYMKEWKSQDAIVEHVVSEDDE